MKCGLLMCITAMTVAAIAAPAWLFAQEQHEKERIRYTVTDLGLASFFTGGINDKAWVDYSAILPDGTEHATLFRRGRKIDLGTLGGPNSSPVHRTSEKGQVVGQAETSTKDPLGEDFCGYGTNLICLGFVWQNGLMLPLPILGGHNAAATDINDRGEIVGNAETDTPDPTCPPPQVLQSLPVIWKNGEIHELPTLSGDPDGSASAINDRGQIVGASANCTTPFHAVLWQNDTVTDLGSLGGSMGNFATNINNRGQVIGLSDLPGDQTNDAFLWTEGNGMKDLGTLPGDVGSGAFGINENGQVVGLGSRAIFWQNGTLTDLNTLIPGPPFSPLYLLFAYDINSNGEIVGVGLANTGEFHAFVATPCDQDHTGTKGCNDVDISTGAEQPAPVGGSAGPSTPTPSNLAIRGRINTTLDRFRSRQFRGRYFLKPWGSGQVSLPATQVQ